MASENETVAEVVGLMQNEGYYRGFMGITNPLTDRMVSNLLDRIESAHKREVAELKTAYDRAVSADARHAVDNERLKLEVAELRECLKEAIKKQCKHKECKNNVCFFVEFGKEDECVVYKWRKALEGGAKC